MFPLTILVATIDGETKLAKILPQLREVADQLVVGIDDTTTDDSAAVARQFADTICSLPHDSFATDGSEDFKGPLEHLLPHCKGEWILRVDHDETLSDGWNNRDRVLELLRDRRATHYNVLRRWVVPPGDRFISSRPWYPDYSIRLFRNLPSLIHGPRAVHTDITLPGEARWLTHEWVNHWDLVWHSREYREDKVKFCEQLGPWSGADHYLFEGRKYETLPLGYMPPTAAHVVPEISTSDNSLACSMEALEVPQKMVTGVKYSVLIGVRNLSPRVFSPGIRGGRDGNVLASHHWFDESGVPVKAWTQERMELPKRLEPGQSAEMFLPVVATPPPGRYLLQFDLVEENVAWSGYTRQLPTYPVEVVAAN